MGLTYYKQVWEHSKQKGSHKLALLALAEHTNEHTGQCNPSHETLADMVGVTTRQIRRVLDDLAESGEIEIITHRGRTLTNQYNIVLSTGAENRTSSAESDTDVLFSDDKIGHPAQKSEEMSYEPITTTTTTSANAEVQSPNGDVPLPSVKARKPRKAREPTGYTNPTTGVSTHDIQAAYLEALAHAEPGAAPNYGEMGKAAKKMAEKGRHPSEVTTCFWKLKKQEYWEEKHLSLASVGKQIGATLNGKDAVRTYQSTNGTGPAYRRMKQL